MPLKKDNLDKRGDLPAGEWRETDDVPVGHMVYHLAESIANAQTKLDLNAAEVAKTLDETEVEIVPRIVQRVDEDGNVTTERDDPVKRTLLEIGFTPSRYHFSEAVIEVDFDTKMSEESETDTESNVGMRAGTSEARQHRKYNRSVETNTHVKAKLEPMAPPQGLTPERSTQPAEPATPESPEGDAGDGGPGGSTDDAAEEAVGEGAGGSSADTPAAETVNGRGDGSEGADNRGGGEGEDVDTPAQPESASAGADAHGAGGATGDAQQGEAGAPQGEERAPAPTDTTGERPPGSQG